MNPSLERLGLGADDRAVIVHADDVGMCHSTLSAYVDLLDAGLTSSAAVMSTCAWFPSLARICRERPEADIGVHLTLTCEWDAYRWGPLSCQGPESGLLDSEGYLHRTSRTVWRDAASEAVQREIAVQLDRALRAGIDATHIDTHMGTLAHPRFLDAYVELGLSRRIPPMVKRFSEPEARAFGLDRAVAGESERVAARLEAEGAPVFDAVAGLPTDDPANRIARTKQVFDGLPPGLSLFILHPAADTPELRALAPDWRGRVADYEAFASPELGAYVRGSGIRVIGYRELRDQMRVEAS